MKALAHLVTPVLFVSLFFSEQRMFLERGEYLPNEVLPLASALALVVATVLGVPLDRGIRRCGWQLGPFSGGLAGAGLACFGYWLSDGFIGSRIPFIETPIVQLGAHELQWLGIMVAAPGFICGIVFVLLARVSPHRAGSGAFHFNRRFDLAK